MIPQYVGDLDDPWVHRRIDERKSMLYSPVYVCYRGCAITPHPLWSMASSNRGTTMTCESTFVSCLLDWSASIVGFASGGFPGMNVLGYAARRGPCESS
jgi:hypothetical protein